MDTKIPSLREALRLRDWLPSRGNLLFTLLVTLCLIGATTSGVLAAPQRMAAQSGASTGTIAYQGRLADASGAPLTGAYILTFHLYNAASGGSPLWEEIWIGANNVQVTNGLFNVMLGSITPIPQSLFTGNNSLWLGIAVGSDAEMTPRVQLGSAPFAFQAQHANLADSASSLSGPGGSPANAVIVDGSGNVGIGAASPQAKLEINGKGGLLRVWNMDPYTMPTGSASISVGNTNAPAGGSNSWFDIASYGDGYTGVLTSSHGGDALSQNRVEQLYSDGEAMIFANFLDKPFYFYQGGGYSSTSHVSLTIGGNGNVGIGTTTPSNPLEMASGAYVSSGGVWTNVSDRNLKENFTSVNDKSLLEKIASLPISEWNYKAENSSVKHIGPVAQDFYAAFNLGEDDKHISTVDASGVALAAIQSLDRQAKEQDSRIAALQQQNATLQQQNAALDARLTALERSGGASTGQPGGLFSAWDVAVILAMAGGLIVYLRPVRFSKPDRSPK